MMLSLDDDVALSTATSAAAKSKEEPPESRPEPTRRSLPGPVARLSTCRYRALLVAPNLVHPVSLLYGHACEGTQSLTSSPQELLSIVRERLRGGTGPGQCVAHRTLTTLLTFASSAHSRAMSHEENSPII